MNVDDIEKLKSSPDWPLISAFADSRVMQAIITHDSKEKQELRPKRKRERFIKDLLKLIDGYIA